MNTIAIRRVYLVWRTDIAAAGLLVLFGVAAFWAASKWAALIHG